MGIFHLSREILLENFTRPIVPSDKRVNARKYPPIPIVASIMIVLSSGMLSKNIAEINGVDAKKKTATSNFLSQR